MKKIKSWNWAVSGVSAASLVAGTASLAGCSSMASVASMIDGGNQSLSVQTVSEDGQPVFGATCTLTNRSGTWSVTAPGTVPISHASGDLSVNCTRPGGSPGTATIKSSTDGSGGRSPLFGGYDYPAVVTVRMGQATTIEPPVSNDQGTAPAADAATATTVDQPDTSAAKPGRKAMWSSMWPW